MADNTDKLLGVRIVDDSTERVWGGHRLDLETEADLDPEDYDTVVKVISTGNKYHSVKDGYAQKVLVAYEEDASGNRTTDSLDAIKADLDEQGINYVEEDVYPTQSERNDIADYEATNDTEVEEALSWGRAVDDLSTGQLDQADFVRGRNPNKGERFGNRKGHPGRGKGPEK